MVTKNRIIDDVTCVSKQSKHIKIRDSGIDKFVQKIEREDIKHWLEVSPYDLNKLTFKEHIAYIFVLDSISFCYWGDPKWTINYKDQYYDGAKAMMICIGDALDKGFPLLEPEYLSQMKPDDLEKVLHGRDIPLFEQRVKILNELGKNTLNQGDYWKIIQKNNNDALNLMENLINTYPSLEDYSIYSGKKVFFNKRAQLLTADIAHIVKETDYKLSNIDKLTACADYKLPQVLRREGIFEYSPELSSIISNKIELIHGSPEEVELRASTICAVERIKEKLNCKIQNITSNQINDCLWVMSQEKNTDDLPYHRTLTTAY